MAARLGRHRHQLPGSHCTPACAIGASPVPDTKSTTHLSFLLLHSLTLRVRDRLTRRDHISVTGSAGRRLRVPATRRSPVSSRPIQTHLAAPAAGALLNKSAPPSLVPPKAHQALDHRRPIVAATVATHPIWRRLHWRASRRRVHPATGLGTLQ